MQIAHNVLIRDPKYGLDAMASSSQHIVSLLLPEPAESSQLLQTFNSIKGTDCQFVLLASFYSSRQQGAASHITEIFYCSGCHQCTQIEVTFILRHGKIRVSELLPAYVSFPDFRAEWECFW